MTRLLLPLAALALAACQQTVPVIEADAEARALTNACLAEIEQPALPEDADSDAAVPLTDAQQEAFSACVARAA